MKVERKSGKAEATAFEEVKRGGPAPPTPSCLSMPHTLHPPPPPSHLVLLEEPVVGLDGLFAAVEAVVELSLELEAGNGAGGLAGHCRLQGLRGAQGCVLCAGVCWRLGACSDAWKKDDDGSMPLPAPRVAALDRVPMQPLAYLLHLPGSVQAVSLRQGRRTGGQRHRPQTWAAGIPCSCSPSRLFTPSGMRLSHPVRRHASRSRPGRHRTASAGYWPRS